ncbi:MAG: sulfur carrier protein ThiS [Thermodesulfobacteriota bacterium]
MQVIINGFPETIPAKTSIMDVLLSRQEYDRHMMVELNHHYIHQRDYQTTVLSEGDELELIHPAFGG